MDALNSLNFDGDDIDGQHLWLAILLETIVRENFKGLLAKCQIRQYVGNKYARSYVYFHHCLTEVCSYHVSYSKLTVTGFAKPSQIAQSLKSILLLTQVLPRLSINIAIDDQVCFCRRLFADPVKP